MDFREILERYDARDSRSVPDTVEDDFDQVAPGVPPDALSDGLAAAFRADETPEFAQMTSQMFGRASGTQRAGILNGLIAAVGPMVLQQILSRRQGGGAAAPSAAGAGGGLGDLLGRVLRGGGAEVRPEEAERVDPRDLEELAREAEKKDPSVIDKVSRVFAEQPQLLKTLGGIALAIALGKVAQRHGTLPGAGR
jgi:hypothetical protein